MEKMGKLELTWVGKYEEEKLEPRILIEDKSKSYGDTDTENMLIHGDNLLALKALEQKYSGRIKCIYIDPPYNTGSAFEHYDDDVEHSIWLSLMYERLQLLYELLSEEGSFWISLDDNEAHYFKVMADEVFGRKNFMADVAWEKADSPRMDAKLFSSRYDHTLVYAKNIEFVKLKQVTRGDIPEHYNKTTEDGRKYYLKPLRYMGNADAREDRPNLYFSIQAPDGTDVYPIRADGSDGRWRWSKEKVDANTELIEWVSGKNGWTAYYRIFADVDATRPPETLWTFQFAGSNRNAKAEVKALFSDNKTFDTPKPEKLIDQVLSIATDEGDWVLDSFLGSGTTVAVAHKKKRKWIGIEMGEHAFTLCKMRMDKVIDGEQGGISKDVNWQGGGGYKFYELAEPLLVKNSVLPVYQINSSYTWDMVCEAICKIEGFIYEPSGEFQGYSSENRFIHITEEFVNAKYVMSIMKNLGERQSLLIYCKKNQADMALPENVEVKKIPKDLLDKCDFESEVQESWE
jgi:adenine-specific DNA-methyltransferase